MISLSFGHLFIIPKLANSQKGDQVLYKPIIFECLILFWDWHRLATMPAFAMLATQYTIDHSLMIKF